MASDMDLTASILMRIAATPSKTADLSTTVSAAVTAQESKSFSDGTGLDQADQIWFDSGTLAATNGVSIDLSGSLTNCFGVTVTFSKIKAILIKNISEEATPASAATLHVGGGSDDAGTAAFDTWISSTAADGSEKIILVAGGAFCLMNPLADGYAVTNSTADILRLKNTSGTEIASYEICIVGVSA